MSTRKLTPKDYDAALRLVLDEHKKWFLHKKWLKDGTDSKGRRLDLGGDDLRDAHLYGADLRGADLSYALLDEARLVGA